MNTVRDNLRALLAGNDMSINDLVKSSGVSERMVKFVLSGGRCPTVNIVNKLAAGFGRPAWHLLIPRLPARPEQGDRLTSLVNNYLSATEESREYIEFVANRESKQKLSK